MPRRFHYQRDQFNRPIDPKLATANVKEIRAAGLMHGQTIAQYKAAHNRKLAKNKAARAARKRNRH
jgi:hypothetical protein